MRLRRWTPALPIAQAKRPTSEHPSIRAARGGPDSLRADNRSGLPAGGSGFRHSQNRPFSPGLNSVGRFFAPYAVGVDSVSVFVGCQAGEFHSRLTTHVIEH